jgi:hypothetical protein
VPVTRKTEKVGTMDTEKDKVENQLEMLDQRLDNIDSVVTNLVERVMHQPVTVDCTCPKCGSTIRIMLTGNIKFFCKNHE